MSNSSSNLDLIRSAYEAFGRGDVPAVLLAQYRGQLHFSPADFEITFVHGEWVR